MAEPIAPVAIAASAGAVSLLPFVNGDSLFGAVIGAAFIAFYTQNVSYKKRLMTFVLSTAIGYLLAPELINRTIIDSNATAAFSIALVAIIVLQKLVNWLENASLADLWNTFRGRPPGEKKDKE